MSFTNDDHSLSPDDIESLSSNWPAILESIGLSEQLQSASPAPVESDAIENIVYASPLTNDPQLPSTTPLQLSSSPHTAERVYSQVSEQVSSSPRDQPLFDDMTVSEVAPLQSKPQLSLVNIHLPTENPDDRPNEQVTDTFSFGQFRNSPSLNRDPIEWHSQSYPDQQYTFHHRTPHSDAAFSSGSPGKKGKRRADDLYENSLDNAQCLRPTKRSRMLGPSTITRPHTTDVPYLPPAPPPLVSSMPSHSYYCHPLASFYSSSQSPLLSRHPSYAPGTAHSSHGAPRYFGSATHGPQLPYGRQRMDYRTLQRNRYTPYSIIGPHSRLQNPYLDPNPEYFANGDMASQAYSAVYPRQDQLWDFVTPLPYHAHLQPALSQAYPDYYNPREYDQYAQQAFVQGSSSAATSRPSSSSLPSPNPFALRQASWTPDPYGSYFAEEHVPEQFVPPPSTDAHSGVPGHIRLPTVPEVPRIPRSSPKQGTYSFVWQDPYQLRATGKKAANSTGNHAAKKRPRKKQAVAIGPATMASTSSHVGTAAHLSPIHEDTPSQDLATYSSPGGPTNGDGILQGNPALIVCDFICEDGVICGQTFTCARDRKRHLQSVHQGKRAGPCICDKMFSRSDAWKRHVEGPDAKACLKSYEAMAIQRFGTARKWWRSAKGK